METIGRTIRALRYQTEQPFTQQRLADEAGISQSRLSEIEQDHTSPTWNEICAIAKTLNFPPTALLPDGARYVYNTDFKDNAQGIVYNLANFEPERAALLGQIAAKDEVIKAKDELLKAKEAYIAQLTQRPQ